MLVRAIRFAASGIIWNGPCTLCGFLLGTDGVNDPTVTLYNALLAKSGTDVVPTTTFEASVFGFNGFMPGYMEIHCPDGLYAEVANMGTGEGVVYVRSI